MPLLSWGKNCFAFKSKQFLFDLLILISISLAPVCFGKLSSARFSNNRTTCAMQKKMLFRMLQVLFFSFLCLVPKL